MHEHIQLPLEQQEFELGSHLYTSFSIVSTTVLQEMQLVHSADAEP